MDWRTIFILLHIFGTILGVGGVTFALVFQRRALADGRVDPSEGAFLGITYTMLRIGLVLLVLSGFGILLLARLEDHAERLYSVRLWLKLAITGFLLVNTIAFSLKKIPDWLAHAVSITGWYAAFIIGVWRGYHWSFWAGFIALLFITAFLAYLLKKSPSPQQVVV